jgi:hypothetical protein
MEMCKTLLGFAHFHRHRRHEPKQQKPDTSLATKTGHFHLLPTTAWVVSSVQNNSREAHPLTAAERRQYVATAEGRGTDDLQR